jgi:peptidoglycan hydrolase-like protein with peptidoglycan-binding domain
LRLIRLLSVQVAIVLIGVLAASPALAATKHKKTSKAAPTKVSSHKVAKKTTKYSRRTKSKHYQKTAKKSWKSKGQHSISASRTREIQEALIREHYLDGEPTGEWDSRTQDAMRRFQADQGWQTKVLPDSRALIKLGLGPDRSDVLNPDTAATSPYRPTATGGSDKPATSAMVPATTVVRDQ